MAAPNLGVEPEPEEALVSLLKTEPFRVKFFEAVRLLRRLLPERKAVGHFVPPKTEVVRFVANPSLEFPASEIQALEWPDDPGAPIKMMVNFMGLAAPNGVLPEPYVELILERAQKKVGKDRRGQDKFDNGFRDFLDIFNHRFISLFYRVWEKHHFYVPYEERETDQLTPLLMSFIGLGTKGLLERQVVSDQALAYYAGILGQRPRSAQALHQILEDYFDVPVEVVQFVGRWIRLPLADQTQFEDTESVHVQLGFGAVAGDEIWDQQSMVRIKIGPLSLERYLDFLPTPAWNTFTTYFPGDSVTYAGETWTALVETIGTPPGPGSEIWKQYLDFLPTPTWNMFTTYFPGNRVSYRGKTWTALAATIGTPPGPGSEIWNRGHGRAYPALKSLLKFYSNDQLDFQVQLVLKEKETPALQLTGDPGGTVLLGWVTWIKNADLGRNPAETILEM